MLRALLLAILLAWLSPIVAMAATPRAAANLICQFDRFLCATLSGAEFNIVPIANGGMGTAVLGRLYVNERLLEYADDQLAVAMVHELQHVQDFAAGWIPYQGEPCLEMESRAMTTQVRFWSWLYGRELPKRDGFDWQRIAEHNASPTGVVDARLMPWYQKVCS